MNQHKPPQIQQSLAVPAHSHGQRIDQFLAAEFPEHSRGAIQQWIESGQVLLNGQPTKAKTRLKGFERIDVDVTLPEHSEDQPQDMNLDAVFADDHLFVINKPAGLVVHPAAGNPDQTLLNGLLFLDESQRVLPRAGIVHRLDKDTSGLMVVARTPEAYNSLVDQLKERSVKRQYLAIAKGRIRQAGRIDKPIGRHKTQRTKMAVTVGGKPAVTHFQPIEQFRHYTACKVDLETGRTHQIRVHFNDMNHPLVGDPVYGNPKRVDPEVDEELKDIIRDFPRQALHAKVLSFQHPHSGHPMKFSAPVPDDIDDLLHDLRELDALLPEGEDERHRPGDSETDGDWDVFYEE